MSKIFHLYPKQIEKRPSHVSVPKRFVYFWEISNYLSQHCEVNSVDAVDPLITTYGLAEELLKNKYDIAVILVRVDNVRESIRISKFFKEISPEIKILFYGDIVNLIPKFFKKYNFIDALVVNGDWEDSILSYVHYVKMGKKPRGLFIKELNKTYKGRRIGNNWCFTDTKKAPINLYNKLNGKKQLSLSVSRGCPFACKFCLATETFGEKDRRKSIQEILNYCESNKNVFESFKFFSPNFTLNKKWVKRLCKGLIKKKINIKWASTTRIEMLDDEELINLMAESGCYKIAVGIEIPGRGAKFLKREIAAKRSLIKRVAKLFNKTAISLKALVMLGVPGQTARQVKEMFTFLEENNIKIRPTSYSPLGELAQLKNIAIEKIENMDKLTYYKYGIKGVSKKDYFRLILSPESYKDILK